MQAEPKRRSITEQAIAMCGVEGLHRPVFRGPTFPQRGVAIVNFTYQFHDRLPAERARRLGPDVEVNARDKQIAVGLDEARNPLQATFCSGGPHVTQEAVSHHNVLRAQQL